MCVSEHASTSVKHKQQDYEEVGIETAEGSTMHRVMQCSQQRVLVCQVSTRTPCNLDKGNMSLVVGI